MSGPTPPDRGQEPVPGQQPGYGQPPSQQPGYGQPPGPPPGYAQQPGYGQPVAMGPETTRMARVDPGPGLSFGVFGALVAAVGAILVVVSFTALDWFTKGSQPSSHFSDIHRVLTQEDTLAAGTAKVYFAWLGWALLVAVFVFALLANLPWPLATAFRVLGVIAAVAAIGLTFWAIKLISAPSGAPAYHEYLSHARIGFYFAVGGFVLLGIGALIGPSREHH